MEGVVVKNYNQAFYRGNLIFPILCAKYVSEAFKEVHRKTWSGEHTGKGKYEIFLSQYGAEARWNKAIQKRAEVGELENSPRDIGPLIKLIQNDVLDEEEGEIKEALFKIFKEDVSRASIRGFPMWYKDKLASTLEETL